MDESEFRIRPYRDGDKRDVIELWYQCGLVVPLNNPELDIERKLKVNPELFLVGLVGEKVIATVMGGYEGHRGWINYLAVSEDYRRRGFGRRLMEAVEGRLGAMDCPKINLQVRADNHDVIRFYENIGYVDDRMTNLGKRLVEDPEYGS